MQKPGIFRTLEYSELFHNYMLAQIQNPVIFTKQQTLCNPVNSEPWHTDNPEIFRTLKYLKLDTCSEPYQRFKMECFAKIIKSYDHFSKALYLRSLLRFRICRSPNKYSLTSRVTSHCVFYVTFIALQCCIQMFFRHTIFLKLRIGQFSDTQKPLIIVAECPKIFDVQCIWGRDI